MQSARTIVCTTLLLVAGLTVLGGCTSRTVKDDPMLFDEVGPMAVHVESFNGDVNIYVDESLEQTSVRVVRESDFGRRRTTEAAEALDAIQYTAEIAHGDAGPVLNVRTWTDWPETYHQAAHVTIYTPAVDDVMVATTRGRVYVVNSRGSVDISTTEGHVRFMTNWPMNAPVSIENAEGDIDYRVRSEAAAHITAMTDDGQVRIGARYGDMRITEHTGNRIVATLNGGDNPVRLHTTEGDVRVSVTNNPTEVGLFIIDP